MLDGFHDECGIFAVYNAPEKAATLTALGLHALQHRGQESVGIVSYDRTLGFSVEKAMGLVGEDFISENVLSKLPGNSAIGHVRYSTSGGKSSQNIQPIFAELNFGSFAIAHNGNLTNASVLRRLLVEEGAIFQSTMDTEVIIHLVAKSKHTKIIDKVIDAFTQIEGAFSLIAIAKDVVYAMRDRNGIRPMVLGKLGDSYIISSETCALDIIGATLVRDVEPGELIILQDGKIKTIQTTKDTKHKFCVFEYIYFARPDSTIEGRNVYEVRKNIGVELAKETAIDADIVVPVPDSGIPSALGFSNHTGIPIELAIVRSHYIGRTFIEPTQAMRDISVKLKHNANSKVIKGKRVVLIDDSIVRGTTSKKIVNMIRDAGAKEVHMRISSPPITNPCFYGIDTPNKDELVSNKYNTEELCRFIGADTLSFISVDGLYRAVLGKKRNNKDSQFCDACFTGDYFVKMQF